MLSFPACTQVDIPHVPAILPALGPRCNQNQARESNKKECEKFDQKSAVYKR